MIATEVRFTLRVAECWNSKILAQNYYEEIEIPVNSKMHCSIKIILLSRIIHFLQLQNIIKQLNIFYCFIHSMRRLYPI